MTAARELTERESSAAAEEENESFLFYPHSSRRGRGEAFREKSMPLPA